MTFFESLKIFLINTATIFMMPPKLATPGLLKLKKLQKKKKDFILLFIQKHIYNRHINKMKKSKTKIHITIIRCKATITPEIKLKEEQLQN